jgi:TM2 domain-containing membrane protein YozV
MAIIVLEKKTKTTAYLLWFFLGLFGVHKFYLEKTGMGILYLCTGGLLGIGWLIDLFTLGGQVDEYNAIHSGNGGPQQIVQPSQNVMVNITAPTPDLSVTPVKISAEKQILELSKSSTLLSLKQIVGQTNLEIEEAETAIKYLVDKGMATEQFNEEGKIIYNFN